MSNYNTGVTATLTAQPHGTAFTFTVPAGVLTGDVMVFSLEVFTQNGSSNSFSTPSSGGGNWTQIGPTLTGTYTGGGTFPVYGFAFWRVATAADPGSTFTMSYTGTTPSPDQIWWSGDFESYTGFYTASPVGNFATFNNGNSSTITAPTTTTTAAGSWEVDTCPVSVASSGTYTSEPLTNRHTVNTQGINCAISDSNGSVGASGTTIGGGNWVLNGAVNNSGMAFTIELRTAAPGSAASSTGYPLTPPGRLSPPTIGLPAVPVQAPQSPPTGQATPYPLTPPGLQSPMSLGVPLSSPTSAPPTGPLTPPVPYVPGTQTPLVPPGLQSPMSLGVPLTAPSPAPQTPPTGQAVFTPLVPPGRLSPMSLPSELVPGSQAAAPAPPVVVAVGAGSAPLSAPGRLSPMAIGIPLTAPSPAPQTPPVAAPIQLPVPGGGKSMLAKMMRWADL